MAPISFLSTSWWPCQRRRRGGRCWVRQSASIQQARIGTRKRVRGSQQKGHASGFRFASHRCNSQFWVVAPSPPPRAFAPISPSPGCPHPLSIGFPRRWAAGDSARRRRRREPGSRHHLLHPLLPGRGARCGLLLPQAAGAGRREGGRRGARLGGGRWFPVGRLPRGPARSATSSEGSTRGDAVRRQNGSPSRSGRF